MKRTISKRAFGAMRHKRRELQFKKYKNMNPPF